MCVRGVNRKLCDREEDDYPLDDYSVDDRPTSFVHSYKARSLPKVCIIHGRCNPLES